MVTNVIYLLTQKNQLALSRSPILSGANTISSIRRGTSSPWEGCVELVVEYIDIEVHSSARFFRIASTHRFRRKPLQTTTNGLVSVQDNTRQVHCSLQ